VSKLAANYGIEIIGTRANLHTLALGGQGHREMMMKPANSQNQEIKLGCKN